MAEESVRCAICLDGGDVEENAAFTRELNKYLLELQEVEAVERGQAAAVPGTKSGGIDPQALIVTLAASGGIITTLIGAIQAFALRRERASITVEMGGDKITITGGSSEAEKKLVDQWVRRHNK